MKRVSFLAAAVLTLAACSSLPQNQLDHPSVSVSVSPAVIVAPAPKKADPLSQLSAFTLADLQAASADAHAQTPPDVTAYQCYDYLIALVPTITPPGQVPTMGAILIFQKNRDLANGLSTANSQLKSLNLACAPLVIDTQTLINRLALIGAGTAAIVP